MGTAGNYKLKSVKFIAVLCLLLSIVPMPACRYVFNSTGVISDVVYSEKVPASFETMIICQVEGNEKDHNFRWACDNGTIKGMGSTVIWVSPSVPGLYNVNIELIDGSGYITDRRVINIEVVDFVKTDLDTSTGVELQFPLSGKSIAGEQFCISPMTTMEIFTVLPWSAFTSYKYSWSDNGGKMTAEGLKEGIADTIGWTSPGGSGKYTVKLVASDQRGNLSLGQVYIYVKNPHCCDPGESYQPPQ